MAFPNSGAQQETNRKILEDLQLKKQLLQKGMSPVGANIAGLSTPLATPINQSTNPTLTGQQNEFGQGVGAASAPRSSFNPTSSTTLGFFIPQDSFYGNSFIPVIPRLDPLPPNQTPPK